MLTDTNIKITTEGRKNFVVGSDTYKVLNVEDLVDNWNTQLKLLSIIAKNQSQAPYLVFVNGFKSQPIL